MADWVGFALPADWLDVVRASSAFIASAGENVVLISIEVKPDNRRVEALFLINGARGQHFVSGAPRRRTSCEEVGQKLGELARAKAE